VLLNPLGILQSIFLINMTMKLLSIIYVCVCVYNIFLSHKKNFVTVSKNNFVDTLK